jgi:glycosyltransferase involved in cell wall biosynthesis
MTPLVSIIIPCHNAAPWLAQTLESALTQTWPEKEIFLIDDGSTDRSLEIARSFEARGVRVLRQSNRGAAAARNAGLAVARGDYLQFLDADDLLTPDKISSQVQLLGTRAPDELGSCRWGRFVSDPADVEFVDGAVFRDFLPMDYMIAHAGEKRMMHPAAWLVPRAVAERAGPWNETLSLNDDGEYFARVVLASRGIAFSTTGASLYRSQVPGSLSQRSDRSALESLARSVELTSEHMRRAEDSPRVVRALANYWQFLEYETDLLAPDLGERAAREVKALGGSTVHPEMGSKQQLLARLVGWKLSRRLVRWFHR